MTFVKIKEEISVADATLVAVSKTHPVQKIQTVYDLGHRDFGENKVQELMEKVGDLPDDIRWHMIGHLQSNKVKYLAPFVHLIHSLDRLSLAKEINKEGRKADRVISVLLQIKIAKEDTKFGLDPESIEGFMEKLNNRKYDFIKICGVMGMATFTNDEEQIRSEFLKLEDVFRFVKDKYFQDDPVFNIKSYGMSADYKIALDTGSNMVRVGSLIFGDRNY
ncbi:YggS family pyridoxal phosphate-dependent enzyme [Membranicola marinus]|uniref:Pyridoxal phosphate homeostasis protein n=1 Tax=Membranihabitans marinus TaxID=1227546 RepID=A0A953HK35_9BACT|nr:YggS family pyridoxal phosphate-dependent enzyme [Membranihabitans marinus]MBY5957157.1 YggS family pyridoxal phosphate-dependent enzyme [Membranihabitans marinus]